MIIEKVIKILNYYKKQGLFQFVKHLFERLGFTCYNRTLIFLHIDLKNIPNDFKEPYSFIIATADDIEREKDYNDGWFEKKKAINRLQNGHRLFIVKDKNKIVYFIWIELRNANIAYFDLHFPIPQDMVHLIGAYTIPEFRNRGIGHKIQKEVIHYVKKEGFKNIIGIVDPANITALKLHQRVGFKEYQIINYRRYWHVRHFTVQKSHSQKHRTFITVFKTPKNIWKTYL